MNVIYSANFLEEFPAKLNSRLRQVAQLLFIQHKSVAVPVVARMFFTSDRRYSVSAFIDTYPFLAHYARDWRLLR